MARSGLALGLSLLVAACAWLGRPAVPPLPAGLLDSQVPPDVVERIRRTTLAIDDARLRAAGDHPDDWITYGRTYSEERFSPLAQIDEKNVARLGLAWSLDTNTDRGLEATPLVVDGILFTTGSWSVVMAVDARTGKLLWRWDPQVPREYGARACCDVVNRGPAVYRGRIYAGVLDGRLAALDAATGALVWQVQTVDTTRPYTITGAPRVVQGKVIIGNGGAELGVRGYVSAYDAESGKLVWRAYTVPGDPAKGFESKALERAASTWSGGPWWEIGGGGTVWDAIAYDPELDLLYVGTGNGSPWTRYLRSPGGGDNLYLSSILALRPSDGELVWHYQTTPGDNWDYTATQQLILTELPIAGRPRKVIMQAPKNGFFFVLDRATGEFLSAEKYVEATWAERIDAKTGRPVESKDLDYRKELKTIKPSPLGGHNWHPMSFNPKTGLVYIPAQEIPGGYELDPEWKYRPGTFNTGINPTNFRLFTRDVVDGHLLAWDPVRQREAWRAPYGLPWNGGTLTTAGNLVFQGTADGRFVAYRATDGKKLWQAPAGTGVIAGPVTYRVDGVQYVSVMAGWGGAFALIGGEAAAAAGVRNVGRLLTFALDAKGSLPPPPEPLVAKTATPPPDAPPEAIARGEELYHRWCAACHGARAVSGGVLPDLRFSPGEIDHAFDQIVLDGILSGRGMPGHRQWLTAEDSQKIHAYIRQRASERPSVR